MSKEETFWSAQSFLAIDAPFWKDIADDNYL